jgi:hypothetical protein
MKLSAAAKVVVFTGALATLGCQEVRPASPTAASLFIPNIEGVWNGPMTRVSTSGGECTGAVINTFLPSTDRGTIAITQSGPETAATMTMESTGLACRYTGTSTLTSIAMNAASCDRTGLLVSCADGQTRELRLVGSSVTAAWDGSTITGQATSTYNVFTPPDGLQNGVGSLIATHNFTATRR